jgi:hypothetical protein
MGSLRMLICRPWISECSLGCAHLLRPKPSCTPATEKSSMTLRWESGPHTCGLEAIRQLNQVAQHLDREWFVVGDIFPSPDLIDDLLCRGSCCHLCLVKLTWIARGIGAGAKLCALMARKLLACPVAKCLVASGIKGIGTPAQAC